MSQITEVEVIDLRFPTSLSLDGSDAMNPDPDYSAAYLIVSTDGQSAEAGHGFCCTNVLGNDIQTESIRLIADTLIGRNIKAIIDDMGEFWKELVHDSQLRWLGPEKGGSHMAIGA